MHDLSEAQLERQTCLNLMTLSRTFAAAAGVPERLRHTAARFYLESGTVISQFAEFQNVFPPTNGHVPTFFCVSHVHPLDVNQLESCVCL